MRYFYENKGMGLEARYSSRLEFGAHLHEHLEMIHVCSGTTTVMVDSAFFPVSGGDYLLIFPNQIHQFTEDKTEGNIVCIFSSRLCPELSGIFENKIPVSPVIPAASTRGELVSLIRRTVEVEREKPPYADVLLRGYLSALLGELLGHMEFTAARTFGVSAVRDILNYCSAHYMSDISLESLAGSLHMSRHYISHLFSEKLHMSFPDYIGMLRVSEAQRYLSAGGMSITEIAYQVGFNSTRSFNRTFGKLLGMTPSQYRKGRSGPDGRPHSDDGSSGDG